MTAIDLCSWGRAPTPRFFIRGTGNDVEIKWKIDTNVNLPKLAQWVTSKKVNYIALAE